MTIQKAVRDVSFYFVLGDFFRAFLVAGVVFAFRINIGRKSQPLAVRRPDWIAGASRKAGNFFQRTTRNIDRPDLTFTITRRNKREPLSVRRPAWRRRRVFVIGQLAHLSAGQRDQVDLSRALVRSLVDVGN